MVMSGRKLMPGFGQGRGSCSFHIIYEVWFPGSREQRGDLTRREEERER